MSKPKRVLVALDLTAMDEHLLQYVHYLSEAFGDWSELVLVHNVKHNFPEEVQVMLEDLDKTLDDFIREDVQSRVKAVFEGSKLPVKIEITEEDSTSHAIARVARDHKADLVVAGKKVDYTGSGIVSARLIRLLETPLLLIPEKAKLHIGKVVVGVDFSKHAANALVYALNFREGMGADVLCHHVYHIPMRYFPYIPTEDISNSMLKNAEKAYRKFIRNIPAEKKAADTPCDFTPGKNKSIAQNIYAHAIKSKAGLIVTGARGHTLFIGSVADGLANMDMQIPLLIAR